MSKTILKNGDIVRFKEGLNITDLDIKLSTEEKDKVFVVKETEDHGLSVTFDVPFMSFLYGKWFESEKLTKINKFSVGEEVSIKEWYEMKEEYGVTATNTGQYAINIVPYFTVQMKNNLSLEPFKIKSLEHKLRDGKDKIFVTPELKGGAHSSQYCFGLFNLTEEMIKGSCKNKLDESSVLHDSEIYTYVHGNEIIVTIEKNNMSATGISRCCPDDEFDFITGFIIAKERAEVQILEEMNSTVWKKGTKVRIKGIEYSDTFKRFVCASEYCGKYATLLKDYDLSKSTTIDEIKFELEYMEAINKHNGRVKFSLTDIELV